MILINKSNDISLTNLIGNMFSYLENFSSLFIYKVVFILFLFTLHIWFINENSLGSEKDSKESFLGNFNKIFKDYSGSIIGIGSLYTVYLGFITAKMNKEVVEGTLENKIALDKALEDNKQISLDSKSLFKDMRDLKYKFKGYEISVNKLETDLNSIDSSLTQANQYKIEQDQLLDKYMASSDPTERIRYQAKIYELSRKIQHSLDEAKNLNIKAESEAKDLSSKMAEELVNPSSVESNNQINDIKSSEEINKASIIDLEWFNSLDLFKQLAVSLLICQSVICSALVSIIFSVYGDYLIDKFNLEKKYPKLSTLIKYRRMFSKYYFIHGCVLIVIMSLSQIAFSVAILSS